LKKPVSFWIANSKMKEITDMEYVYSSKFGKNSRGYEKIL